MSSNVIREVATLLALNVKPEHIPDGEYPVVEGPAWQFNTTAHFLIVTLFYLNLLERDFTYLVDGLYKPHQFVRWIKCHVKSDLFSGAKVDIQCAKYWYRKK